MLFQQRVGLTWIGTIFLYYPVFACVQMTVARNPMSWGGLLVQSASLAVVNVLVRGMDWRRSINAHRRVDLPEPPTEFLVALISVIGVFGPIFNMSRGEVDWLRLLVIAFPIAPLCWLAYSSICRIAWSDQPWLAKMEVVIPSTPKGVWDRE